MKILNKLQNIIKKSIIKAVSTDFFVQLLSHGDDDVNPSVPIYQHFGFASIPPVGTYVMSVLPGANGESQVTIAEVSKDDLPSLTEGDAAIFGRKDSGGDQAYVHCKDDNGTIELSGDTHKLCLADRAYDHMYAFASAVAIATTVGGIASAATTLKLNMENYPWESERGRIDK